MLKAEQRASPGRPKLITTESQLSYLSDYWFKAVDMARMFDVSVATIHRRLRDLPVGRSTDLAIERLGELGPFLCSYVSICTISDDSFQVI